MKCNHCGCQLANASDVCPNCDKNPFEKPKPEELDGVLIRTLKAKPEKSIIGHQRTISF